MTKRYPTEAECRHLLALDSGRILTVEQVDEDKASADTLLSLAQNGSGEGYVIFAESEDGTLHPYEKELFLSFLLRPSFPLSDAGLLSATAGLAVARAVEKATDLTVKIRWVNELFCGNRKTATVAAHTRVNPSGFFDYAVLDVCLSLPEEYVRPKLGDVVQSVFADNAPASPYAKLVDAVMEEFFDVFDRMESDRSFMEDYCRRSTVIGKHATLRQNGKRRRGKIVGIDRHACLLVELRDKSLVTVSSRSEIDF